MSRCGADAAAPQIDTADRHRGRTPALIQIKSAARTSLICWPVNDLRLDIIPLAHGWVLTDSGAGSRVFLSSSSAIDEAKQIARRHAGRVTVFIWNDATETKIFDSADEGRSD